jgi:hypothetical protein
MENLLHVLKRILQNFFYSILIIGLPYLFIAFISLSLNPLTWSWFARFTFSTVILIDIILTYQAISATIKNIRIRNKTKNKYHEIR